MNWLCCNRLRLNEGELFAVKAQVHRLIKEPCQYRLQKRSLKSCTSLNKLPQCFFSSSFKCPSTSCSSSAAKIPRRQSSRPFGQMRRLWPETKLTVTRSPSRVNTCKLNELATAGLELLQAKVCSVFCGREARLSNPVYQLAPALIAL